MAIVIDGDGGHLRWQQHCRTIRVYEFYNDDIHKRKAFFFFFLFRVFLKIFYSLELQVKHKINYGWEFRGQSREVEGDGVFIPTSGNISKSLL